MLEVPSPLKYCSVYAVTITTTVCISIMRSVLIYDGDFLSLFISDVDFAFTFSI